MGAIAALLVGPACAFVQPAALGVPRPSLRASVERPARAASAQMKSDRGDGKVNRRFVLALATLPVLGLRKAEAMTEAEEIAKLQAEAARIQEIFDVQKAASANLPSLKDSLKVAKSAVSSEEQVAKGPLKSEDPAGTLVLCARGGQCVGSEPRKRAVCLPQTSKGIATFSEESADKSCVLLRWAATDMKDVQKVVAKLMTSLQTEGEKGMVVVLEPSSQYFWGTLKSSKSCRQRTSARTPKGML